MSAFARKIAALALICALTIALAGCAQKTPPEAQGDADAAARSFPAFAAETLFGGSCDSSVFSLGELTAACLWTADCPYCSEQLAALGELASSRGKDGVRALAILIDASGDEAKLEAARAECASLGGSVTLAVAGPDFDYTSLLAEGRVPCTVFVDGEGAMVSEQYVGARDAEEWGEIASRLMAAKKG